LYRKEQWPAFAIQDVTKNQKFPYDQTKEITAKEIEKFVASYVDGSMPPSIKSEPIPETQEGPVTVVVAHNYNDIVLDDKKDVLIEFYAPWVCSLFSSLTSSAATARILLLNTNKLLKLTPSTLIRSSSQNATRP
jgi:hypothetical protein